MREDSSDVPRETVPSGRLADLLACERDLADRMRAAREEASRRVEEARRAAQRADAESEASLEAEAQEVRSEVRTRCQGRVREILAAARLRGARFEGISEQEVGRLAGLALTQLLGRGASS